MDPRASLINAGANRPQLICLTNSSQQRARHTSTRTVASFRVNKRILTNRLLQNTLQTPGKEAKNLTQNEGVGGHFELPYAAV